MPQSLDLIVSPIPIDLLSLQRRGTGTLKQSLLGEASGRIPHLLAFPPRPRAGPARHTSPGVRPHRPPNRTGVAARARAEARVRMTPVERASCRDRHIASHAILERLRELSVGAHFEEESAWGPAAVVRLPNMEAHFWRWPDGVYFALRRLGPAGGVTGYLDPILPGNCAGGALHITKWCRGWEADLFGMVRSDELTTAKGGTSACA
jgi:hypothetical protein